MSRKINAISVNGPAGNGKSTFITLLAELLKPRYGSEVDTVACIDTSAILTRWGMSRRDDLGTRLRRQAELITCGKYLPDNITNETIARWLDEVLSERPKLKTLIIAGAPRTPGQYPVRDLFQKFASIHIKAEKAVCDEAMRRRALESPGRPDDQNLEKISETRWDEYVRLTVPTMNMFNGAGLELDRSSDLTQRLRETLSWLLYLHSLCESPVEYALITSAQDKLANASHSIHGSIRFIEGTAPFVSAPSFEDVRPTRMGRSSVLTFC